MYVTIYTRNRAAEKKAAEEAKVAEAPKKRGRPRKQRKAEKWFVLIVTLPIRMAIWVYADIANTRFRSSLNLW